MAYNNLINEIDQYIRTNGEGEISAEVLNRVLKDMVNTLGEAGSVEGINRQSEPNQDSTNVVYIALEDGVYPYFGNINVQNEVALITLQDKTWVKQSYKIPAQINHVEVATDTKGEDTPSADAEIEGDTLKITLYDIKGEKGDKVDVGMSATVEQGDSESAVVVTITEDKEPMTGKDQSFSMTFRNIKGEQGKSAKDIYNEVNGTSLDDVGFINVLKQNYPMKYVAYYETAAEETIGTAFDSIDDLAASSETANKIWLMPNNPSTPTGTILFVTVQTGASTYKWYKLGDLDVPSNVLLDSNIDDELTDGAATDTASAKAVMELKSKLGSIDLTETKVAVVTDGAGQNVTSEYYVDGSTGENTHPLSSSDYQYYAVFETPLQEGTKSVRFCAGGRKNSDYKSGYAFGKYVSGIWTPIGYGYFPVSNYESDMLLPVPDGATHFRTTCKAKSSITQMDLDKFYCYLQEGSAVKDELDKKVPLDDIGKFLTWKKNLISQDRGTYVEGGVWTSEGWYDSYNNHEYGMNSNPLYLEDGVEYTASKVNIYLSGNTCLIAIAQFNENDEFLGLVRYDAEKTNGSASSPNSDAGKSTFTYRKHRDAVSGEIDEAYCRIRLRYNSNNSYWQNAQVEIGHDVTEYAEYHAEKYYDIAKESEIKSLEDKHDEDIEELNNKFKYDIFVEVTPNETENGKGIVDYRRKKSKTDVGYLRLATQSGVEYKLYKVTAGEKLKFKANGSIGNTNTVNYAMLFLTGEWEGDVWQGEIFPQLTDDESSYVATIGTTYLGKYGRIWSGKEFNADYEFTVPEGCTTIVVNAYDNSFMLVKEESHEYDLHNIDERLLALESAKVTKTELNILAIGNSNSQDSLSYVPFLIRDIAPEIKVNIGILMQSSSTAADHINNFINASESYKYQYCYMNDDAWHEDSSLVSIQQGFDKKKWNIVLFNATQLYENFNELLNLIADYLPYHAKFGIINPAISIAKANGKFYTGAGDNTHGRPYPEGDMESEGTDTLFGRWKAQLDGARQVMDETICEFVLPVDAAICNALTVEEFKKKGDLAVHVNNQNYIDGNPMNGAYGYLRAPDGVHLQEGLPCQIAAYAVILKLMDLAGVPYKSVLGDPNICDQQWVTGKGIPGRHPDETSGPNIAGKAYTSEVVDAYSVTGWSDDEDDNAKIAVFAQKCAIMANKHPYQITDMNDYWQESE